MSGYQLTYQGKSYQFQTLLEAQEFLDKLPSRAGVQIVDAPLLFQLLNAPGAPLTNCQEIIKEINNDNLRPYYDQLKGGIILSVDNVKATDVETISSLLNKKDENQNVSIQMINKIGQIIQVIL